MTTISIDLSSSRESIRLNVDPAYKLALHQIMVRRKFSESEAFTYLIGSQVLKSRHGSKIKRSSLISAISEAMQLRGLPDLPSERRMSNILRAANMVKKEEALVA